MYLGIDYGKKRIGVALGQKIPKPLFTIENKSRAEVIEAINKVCQENEVEKIIIGLPDKIDQNSDQLRSEIKNFGQEINALIGLEVIYEPEAYTSVEAEDRLRRLKKYDRMDKGKIDQEAATLLLEQYISRLEGEK